MRYFLRTNAGYKHLAEKFEQAVLALVGRDVLEMTVCLRSFFFLLAPLSGREWPL